VLLVNVVAPARADILSALAFADEHASFADPQISRSQAQDLAAVQRAQHHRQHHRPIPVRARQLDSSRSHDGG
jgi:hypothetical protein